VNRFTASQPIYCAYFRRQLQPGNWALIEDNNIHTEDGKKPALSQLLAQFGRVEPFSLLEFAPMLDWEQVQAGDRVLIWRSGGGGDILESLPIVYELQERGARVVYCCEDYEFATALLGDVERRHRRDFGMVPIEVDWVVSLEGCVEASTEPTHVLDLYLRRTINPPADLLDVANSLPGGKYQVMAREIAADFIADREPAATYEVILAPYASARNRCIPLLENLPEAFLKQHTFAVVGSDPPPIVSDYPALGKMPVAELYQVLLNARLVVTTDNGLSHLAYWLGVPLIAFYSVVDWRARMHEAEGVCVVDLTDACLLAPCWWHHPGQCPVLANGGEQVASCYATCYLQADKLAQLISHRLEATDFQMVAGRELAGVPDYAKANKGLRYPDGSLVERKP